MINTTAIGKKLLLVLFYCTLCFVGTAQYTPIKPSLKLEGQVQIYFATNSYKLTDKSIKDLQDFLAIYDNSNSGEFRLQAFTDDVGSKTQNEVLAQNRAKAVCSFLEGEDIPTTIIKINASQQLKLDSTKSITEQRQKNRRVDLSYWLKEEETDEIGTISESDKNNNFERSLNASLQSFFEGEQSKFEQYFTFDASKGAFLQGKKGTIVQIPPNCFVDDLGNLVQGTVQFMLKEAYSMGDLMLQNLSTTSNGSLLETGGSIFVGAKDMSGNELSMREESVINIAMASEEASIEGMQTFQGQVDANGVLTNWNPTQMLVQAGSQQSFTNNYTGNYYYQKSAIKEEIEVVLNIPKWTQTLPKEVEKPYFKKRKPQYPILKKNAIPSKQDLKNKHVIQKNETKLDYRKRIDNYYQKEQTVYRKIRKSNSDKISAYKKDSTTYAKAWIQYEKDVVAYDTYVQEMKLLLEEMYKNRTFNIADYEKSLGKLSKQMNNMSYYNEMVKGTLKQIGISIDGFEKEGYDFREVRNKLELITNQIEKMPANNRKKKREEIWDIDYRKYTGKFYKKRSSSSLSQYNHYVCRLFDGTTQKEDMTSYKLKQIRKWNTRLHDKYNFTWLKKSNAELVKKIEEDKVTIEAFFSAENLIMDLQKAYLARKNELNLLTSTEIANIYRSSMKINQLGWINCDRFYNDKSPKIDFEVVATNSNTCIFVVFEDIKAMMAMNEVGNQRFVCNNIPKNRRVKLIGIRVTNEGTFVFEETGTIEQLHKIKPTFKEKDKEEVLNQLAAT